MIHLEHNHVITGYGESYLVSQSHIRTDLMDFSRCVLKLRGLYCELKWFDCFYNRFIRLE